MANQGGKLRIQKKWSEDAIVDQSGRTAIVTGANGGLGFITARELARAGAQVLLACRDISRGEAAAAEIRAAAPGGQVQARTLDLADLGSVRKFAADFGRENTRLDLLINNAGVMATPKRTTADGFELQLGTNHLGHFALTGLLLPNLLAASDPRVVTVSSTLHAYGKITFDDLQRERRYRRYGAYFQAKLANLLFAFELDRRAGGTLRSVAAHPGYAATNLQLVGLKGPVRTGMAISNKAFALSPRMGALPILCAATLPDLPGGAFVGPSKLMGYRGYPGAAKASKRARDTEVAAHLWDVSEAATGVHYALATDQARA
ncbi:oxidoreductase [Frankia sp. CiP3]|uniref:oxidoreductase n=1 Tax=Frankia sp. CiP3 TaxID=2880971 RepID=UPI001EF4B192|nr:oxidoreductase [Frankia sp. CiP3]